MDLHTTFATVAQKWIEIKRCMVKYSSFCAYNLIIHVHLLPVFGNNEAITEDDAQQFVLNKLASGMARKTVKDILATLRAIVRFGEKHCNFPGERWEIAFPTDTCSKSLPVLTVNEHRKLLNHLQANPSVQNIGILIALCTGMRIGEVCALRWSDVNLVHRTITVTQTLGRIYDVEKKQTRREIGTPKTRNSNREIPISKELYAGLRRVKGSATGIIYVVGGGLTPKEPRTYREYFCRLLKRIDLKRIVFHGLRHTFATRCIECGCDYKTVSVILGHSNVATTMNLYVHPNHDQKKRCIDKMSKFLSI